MFIQICSVVAFFGLLLDAAIPVAKCPTGTVVSPVDSQACYLFVNNKTWFSDAELDCISRGGHLTTVDSAFTNNFLAHSGFSSFPTSIDFWVGANNVKSYPGSGFNNPWVWTRNTAIVDFSNWGINEPSFGGNCVSINVQGAFWSAQNCNGNKPYVCQIPASIGVCEEGWALFEHTQACYKFMPVSAGTKVAEQYCAQHSSHLTSIHDEAENDFVANLASMNLEASESRSGVWIGLVNDDDKKHWMWTDGSVVNFTAWTSTNPNANLANTGVAIYPDLVSGCGAKACRYHWDDASHPSSNLRGFICKKSAMKGLLLASN